ncbi:hypothetical protein CCR85_04395 [Rhodothalassium salexigens]|uniref:competence/damage-inducible protein A n=1 Tax=Rhodothalassium salexigens TaxID=1086 RepID=UPI0019145D59|nr:molybdopterin-binding protein [Rhodothalassium salexigens]MBK5910732.1 hypothetical protein [Rhodothalassium salexigens]MBK5919818.1 hypothetical protein [Rhodothalassium salexigens]
MSDTPARPDAPVTAALIVIGDEILSGRTRDANLATLATWLDARGVQLREARVIPDVPDIIAEAVNTCRRAHDYVFTTGGIGPTHDDVTAESVARALGLPLDIHPEAWRLLEAQYAPGEFTPARQRMARVPKGGRLIANPISAAPGFAVGNVYVLAGVPMIMEAMLDSLAHEIVGGAPMRSITIRLDESESKVADLLARVQADAPRVSVGSYPFYVAGHVGVQVVFRATDSQALERAARALEEAAARTGLVCDRVDALP